MGSKWKRDKEDGNNTSDQFKKKRCDASPMEQRFLSLTNESDGASLRREISGLY